MFLSPPFLFPACGAPYATVFQFKVSVGAYGFCVTNFRSRSKEWAQEMITQSTRRVPHLFKISYIIELKRLLSLSRKRRLVLSLSTFAGTLYVTHWGTETFVTIGMLRWLNPWRGSPFHGLDVRLTSLEVGLVLCLLIRHRITTVIQPKDHGNVVTIEPLQGQLPCWLSVSAASPYRDFSDPRTPERQEN
jgi:hypothetical protein